MNWNDLTAAWRRQPGETLPEAHLDTLRKTFKKRSRRLSRVLFWRDVREIAATAFVIFVLMKVALQKGWAGLALWVALVPMLWVLGFMIRERIRSHRMRVGCGATLLTKIDADIAELGHQRTMLLTVRTWGLGPIFVSWLVAMASTGFHGGAGLLRTPLQITSYMLGGVAFFWVVWRLNLWVVRKHFEPRLAELEELRNELMPKE